MKHGFYEEPKWLNSFGWFCQKCQKGILKLVISLLRICKQKCQDFNLWINIKKATKLVLCTNSTSQVKEEVEFTDQINRFSS